MRGGDEGADVPEGEAGSEGGGEQEVAAAGAVDEEGEAEDCGDGFYDGVHACFTLLICADVEVGVWC